MTVRACSPASLTGVFANTLSLANGGALAGSRQNRLLWNRSTTSLLDITASLRDMIASSSSVLVSSCCGCFIHSISRIALLLALFAIMARTIFSGERAARLGQYLWGLSADDTTYIGAFMASRKDAFHAGFEQSTCGPSLDLSFPWLRDALKLVTMSSIKEGEVLISPDRSTTSGSDSQSCTATRSRDR